MGRDESGTLARLREHRKQRFEPVLAQYGGRLVKLTGDGALAEFPSAVDALAAAIEFQQAMHDTNREQAESAVIVFRIGLHLGDLIVEGGDLFGDGVNVASRLEAEAPVGGIVVSGAVHEAVAGRLKATFKDLGRLALKNIERPIQAFAIAWDPADWTVADAPSQVPADVGADPLSPVDLERHSGAIVSVDVAGYSRIMGHDESGTLAALRTALREIVDPRIDAHDGRILKSTGDGLIAEFANVVDAVRCVVEVQTAMAAKVGNVPERPRITFRIGVHLGDIIVADGSIFGDGVYVAASLQEIAEPGGVCLSSRVHDNVRNRLDIAFDDGGTRVLKNFARPIQVWRWSPNTPAAAAATAAAIVSPADAPPALPDKPSIAVLPFQNMSGDPEQEYFADGVVEDIITALSRIRWLFVIARNSSFTYKGEAADVRRVGRELGVHYVLEGSVRKAGGRVRITAQLIDAAAGTHLWADRFDGPLEDVFELQDKVASSVAGIIEPTLEAAEIRRAADRPTKDPTAYDLYLRALSQGFTWKQDGIKAALTLLNLAIARDPQYGPALALAAMCQQNLHVNGWTQDVSGAQREGIAGARAALQASDDDPFVLATAAYVLAYFGEAIDAAIELVDKALVLNPSFARGWVISGWLRLWAGDPDTAMRHLETSLRLSPRARTAPTLMAIGVAHFFAKRFDAATVALLRSLQEHPTWAPTCRFLASCYAHMGRLDEAREVIRRLRDLTDTVVPAPAHWRKAEFREFYLTGLRMAAEHTD